MARYSSMLALLVRDELSRRAAQDNASFSQSLGNAFHPHPQRRRHPTMRQQ